MFYTKRSHLHSNETHRWELHKNSAHCFEEILEATPLQTATVWSLASHFLNPSRQDMQGTIGEARSNSEAIFLYEQMHMDVSMLADQLRLTSALYGHKI